MRKCKKIIIALLCVAMMLNNINFAKIYVSASEPETMGQESDIDISEEPTVSEDMEIAEDTEIIEEDIQYDVGVPHVLINQVYGGKDGAYVSHSFIELYK